MPTCRPPTPAASSRFIVRAPAWPRCTKSSKPPTLLLRSAPTAAAASTFDSPRTSTTPMPSCSALCNSCRRECPEFCEPVSRPPHPPFGHPLPLGGGEGRGEEAVQKYLRHSARRIAH